MKKSVFLILVFLLLNLFFVSASLVSPGPPICLSERDMTNDDKSYIWYNDITLNGFKGDVKIRATKLDGTLKKLTVIEDNKEIYVGTAYSRIVLKDESIKAFNFPSTHWERPSTYHTGNGWRTIYEAETILMTTINSPTNIKRVWYTPYRPPDNPTRLVRVCFYPTSLDNDLDGYGSKDYGGNDCNDNDASINPGVAEVCGDGKDNDCIGGDLICITLCTSGQTHSCYSGSVGTEGIGECKTGTQTCTGGSWGSCTGQVIPQTEICDNKDNDCDGSIDEGCDDDGDGYISTAKDGDDCDDSNANINPGANEPCDCVEIPTEEICDDADEVDEDCDGASNCDDYECILKDVCEKDCSEYKTKLECGTYYINCYWSYAGTCESCFPLPLCANIAGPDCDKYCGMACESSDSDTLNCIYPTCPSDSDLDTICDETPDNCKDVKNIDQSDCDGDGIGDVCDADCYKNSDCDDSLCPIECIDPNGDDVCDDYQDTTTTCDELHGTVCSSGLNCIGGYMISSSDSSKCCLIGSCGIITVLLTGETQYKIEESECKNPNEEGVGKKLVYKYNQKGQLAEAPYEEDCTVLPSETVPFYSLISISITILILISFYAFRRKIFSYLNE